MEISTDKITVDAAGDEILIDPRTKQRFQTALPAYYQIAIGDPLLGPITITKTAHGVKMSPGMSQLYSMLRHHSIRISDFSTDQCVERELPKLRALAHKLRFAPFTPQRWTMLIDVRNLMRRRPETRVK